MNLCERFNLSPFDVLNKDKDDVIMMINYYIEKSDHDEITETVSETNARKQTDTNARIRVNDKTATGGWF